MWEFDFGVGWDPNHASDHLIVKFMLGRRFSWGPTEALIGRLNPYHLARVTNQLPIFELPFAIGVLPA